MMASKSRRRRVSFFAPRSAVRDAASQRAHRLETLRLAQLPLNVQQLLLRNLTIGYVGGGTGPSHHVPCRIAEAHPIEAVPDRLAVADRTQFHREARTAAREELLHRL
jgi:hypothetical protein